MQNLAPLCLPTKSSTKSNHKLDSGSVLSTVGRLRFKAMDSDPDKMTIEHFERRLVRILMESMGEAKKNSAEEPLVTESAPVVSSHCIWTGLVPVLSSKIPVPPADAWDVKVG